LGYGVRGGANAVAVQVGNEFSSVEALWSQFENVMGKDAEGDGEGKDGAVEGDAEGGEDEEEADEVGEDDTVVR
jgi:DASH complex subunit DAD1